MRFSAGVIEKSAEQPVAPLCVDLDGTLIKTDLLYESALELLKRNPLYCLLFPIWLLKGRANLKAQIAHRCSIDVASLPINETFLEYLHQLHKNGRRLILATAANEKYAQAVADHFGIFSEVIASTEHENLHGSKKAAALVTRFGSKGFLYAGNSKSDLKIWSEAAAAIAVDAPGSVRRRLLKAGHVEKEFQSKAPFFKSALKALRPHHWFKNFIIFLPILAAHEIFNLGLLAKTLVAFVSFSFCASAVYILNDLLDLSSDRAHVKKKYRPFASGDLLPSHGFFLVPFLLGLGFFLSAMVSLDLLLVTVFYLILTNIYSFHLKTRPILDVIILASFYSIRLFAGHAATGIEFSQWLLAFSLFFFMSLAFIKRYSETKALAAKTGQKSDSLKGRGYRTEDLQALGQLGTSAGYISILIFVLYIDSPKVAAQYLHPWALWGLVPLLLYWISRVWLIASRGNMNEDPVVFALRDRLSHSILLLSVVVILVARGYFF